MVIEASAFKKLHATVIKSALLGDRQQRVGALSVRVKGKDGILHFADTGNENARSPSRGIAR
jgi:hypothetical protein